jgi:hypothetical protein
MFAYDVAYDIEYDVAYYIFSSHLLCPFRWPVSLQERPGLLCGQRRTAAVPRHPRKHPAQRCFLLLYVPFVVISEHARVRSDQGHGYLRVCAHFQSGHPQHSHSRKLQVFKAVGGLRGDSSSLFSSLRCWPGDPSTRGRVDNFYIRALDCYKDFTYKEFHNSTSTLQGRWNRSTNATVSPRPKLPKSCRSLTSRRGQKSAMLFQSRAEVRSTRSMSCLTVKRMMERGEPALRPVVLSLPAEPAAAAAAAVPAAAANAGPA